MQYLEMAASNNIHTSLLTGESVMRVKANDTIDIVDEILKRQYNIIGMDDVFITYAGLRDQTTSVSLLGKQGQIGVKTVYC